MTLHRFTDSAIGQLLGIVLTSTLAAVIVFCLAYAQELAIWNHTISLGPDLYVAGAMALFAWALTFASFFSASLRGVSTE